MGLTASPPVSFHLSQCKGLFCTLPIALLRPLIHPLIDGGLASPTKPACFPDMCNPVTVSSHLPRLASLAESAAVCSLHRLSGGCREGMKRPSALEQAPLGVEAGLTDILV